MTAQAYFILTYGQQYALGAIAGDKHKIDAKLIDHPFAGNLGANFDGLYALPASIVNESGVDDLLPILASAQIHILDDGLLFARQKAEEHVETYEPKDPAPVEPVHFTPIYPVEDTHILDPVPAAPLVTPAPVVEAAPVALPADTEAHD